MEGSGLKPGKMGLLIMGYFHSEMEESRFGKKRVLTRKKEI
jgi:hypothetical protein